MPSRPSGHAAVGSGSAILGAILLVAGVVRPAPLRGDFLLTPIWALSIVGGCVLALAGSLILLFTFRKPEEVEAVVPAHVAFNSRMTIPDAPPAMPGMPAPRAAGVGGGAPAGGAPAARLPQPAQPAQGRVAAPRTDIARLDEQIRDLTKKINKAGVMLATGQLSQQGYLAYVEDLKRQRGKLEAQRVKAELS